MAQTGLKTLSNVMKYANQTEKYITFILTHHMRTTCQLPDDLITVILHDYMFSHLCIWGGRQTLSVKLKIEHRNNINDSYVENDNRNIVH